MQKKTTNERKKEKIIVYLNKIDYLWHVFDIYYFITTMANRRDLKKGINFLCRELFAECVAITHYQKPTPQEDVDNVMTNILKLQDDMLNRVSHPEPGMPQKDFFKKLRSDMVNHTEEIVAQINALL